MGLIPARAGNTYAQKCPCPAPRAHPRSRGEHAIAALCENTEEGSSPLARGTPSKPRISACAMRLIPARAGNTQPMMIFACIPWAHPRSRGEHPPRSAACWIARGSSPLARGTLLPGFRALTPVGLIPARAGNTGVPIVAFLAREAHPRSRGEHGWHVSPSLEETGSSPLARGTPCKLTHRVHTGGLIPARAGNTDAPVAVQRGQAAHPRSRGEHGFKRRVALMRLGSSPLARGTQSPPQLLSLPHRLIPARAGNTLISLWIFVCFSAHPRSRGEHRTSSFEVSLDFGSSPLARGTPVWLLQRLSLARLIPARAGNTSLRRPFCQRRPAHPRSRGEH